MKIYLVDDDGDEAELFRDAIDKINKSIEFVWFDDVMQALDALLKERSQPDILFLDNNLPDGVGWKEANGLVEQYPGLQVHLISAYQPNAPEKATESFKVWEKPLTLKELDRYMSH